MIFLPLETELFYYEHLLDSSDNLKLIQDFCVSNKSGYGQQLPFLSFCRPSRTRSSGAPIFFAASSGEA